MIFRTGIQARPPHSNKQKLAVMNRLHLEAVQLIGELWGPTALLLSSKGSPRSCALEVCISNWSASFSAPIATPPLPSYFSSFSPRNLFQRISTSGYLIGHLHRIYLSAFG
jgi:hypothetical protein